MAEESNRWKVRFHMKRIKKLFVFILSLVLLLSGISLSEMETRAAAGKTHKEHLKQYGTVLES